MFKRYFKNLYQRTMNEAYGLASNAVTTALTGGGDCLDCGAGGGHWYEKLHREIGLSKNRYHGVEWSKANANVAQNKGLDVLNGDLNKPLPFKDGRFTCVFGLSVIEHLLNPCSYIKECHRTLTSGGTFVLLTPNISTYFTAFLILAGKMPSSGPHPDSEYLVTSQEVMKVSPKFTKSDAESIRPSHRHLVVFSYRVLKKYLDFVGFDDVRGYGFGLYPFPIFAQPVLEKLDPYHCHQMVFIAKRGTR